LSAPLDPIAAKQGPTSKSKEKGREGRARDRTGREGRGREGGKRRGQERRGREGKGQGEGTPNANSWIRPF